MSLEEFIRLADNLVEFEAALNANELPVSSLCLLETHRDEAKSIWSRLKMSYEKCLVDISTEKKDDGGVVLEIESVKEKYKTSYCTYCRCISKLTETIQTFSSPVSPTIPNTNPSFNLPPIELNIFHGDFKSWPTFRDLYTAICIQNSKLSPVEKLFHLSQKTKGEAHEIVSKSPLTNEGFRTAWTNLCARYDNKRVLINEQLKTLFGLSAIHSETAASLKKLQRDINSCISTLRNHQIDTDSWNPIFIFLCSNCLPDSTLTLWEQTLNDKTTIPKWSDFDDFLTNRHRTLESVSEIRGSKEHSSTNTGPKSKTNGNNKSNSGKVRTFQAQVNPTTCKLCPKEVHVIRKCPKFLDMNYNQRLTEIKRHNLCLNCFSSAHIVKDCKSKHSCYKCGKRHNTLLHREADQQKGPTAPSFNTNQTPRNDLLPPPFVPHPSTISNLQSTGSTGNVVQSCFATNSKGVLLGTTLVRILHSGEIYRARALLDSGSEGSFISERLSNMLRLPTKRVSATISGLNHSISAAVQKKCCFAIGSEIDDDFELIVSALVVPHLSNNLPSNTIDVQSLSDLPPLQLADPRFYESAKIDLLLGADVFPSIILSRNRNNICGSLMAQETVFGWILTGPISSRTLSSFSTHVSFFCEISLDKEISRFWEVENIPQKRVLSQDDRFCEELYQRTTKRNLEGRYVVSLPFKQDYPDKLCLGQSKSNAMAQFFRNEGRLLRNPELKKEYDNSLIEYLSLDHMTQVVPGSISQSSYYLPHHAVVKPERTTTKVRVVFNASSPSSNGVSLNDVLYTGPVLQNDLTVLILKWRFYRFVLNGDIQKMYRQILVNPSHIPFQRILFRTSQNDPIQEFELKTVTFGLNCAPYLAIRTMIQLANDVQERYPLASRILRECMYVDDALLGAHSIETAIDARDELIQALHSAGFEMRKWISNSKTILDGLPSDYLLRTDFLEFEDRSSAKTLGIHWNAHSDEFFFSTTQFPSDCSYSKREVLSQIAKLFDPAGWLSPIIIVAKIIMQRIWMDHIEWDEVISPEPLSMWKSFQANYSNIDNMRIPRWFGYAPEGIIEFHGFSDASEKAYAAAIYIRVLYPNSVITHLISSKTKVAPLKTLSIPRLELCGATLLAEMVDNLLPQFDIQDYSLFCWTDSTIVLSWLAKPPCCWNTFVANRVSRITQVVDPSKWSHVESEHNPADLASRGTYPSELINSKLWWNGPTWLSKDSKHWPKNTTKEIEETDLEKKPIKVHFTYFQNFDDVLERFSSFSRALRVIAYVYRFYFNTHPKFRSNYHRSDNKITNSEILFVRKQLISIYQKAFYPNEYMVLSSKKTIPSTSPLLSLNPFVDAEGIMRVCGRLELSPMLSYNERHPILLPYNCQYSRLLIQFIHQISLHGGNQLVLRLVRTQYWIPKVQNLIKTTIHRCKTCIIYKKKFQQQMMASLPPERCEISRPFTHTGLDFSGPFEMKSYAGRCCRISKAYVCVFVCFSTKAIHLETTSDLSTSSFLAAFSRFISRRGCPLHLHSDNGTTFVGASRIMAKEFIQTSHKAITSNYAHQNLTWHFIPPGAPHMGGLWEAGVKSFKQHFKKTIGLQKFTFEEFQTLLSKIEACLNSRPISPSSQNPTDLAALTPGHFLIGSPILAPLEPEISQTRISIQNRWQRLKTFHQIFCVRWKNEYLKELQKRHKWKKPTEDLKEQMLVVIKEENLPPNSWRLGRITKVHRGDDKRVRVADILTQKGTITRPITKLVVISDEIS
ncbi:uncharacterized protein LOC131994814 [Stomoxys calcitrans]|uniref:uncharacterized protein LOC131994814 n=1 Tax=Stomoxys calcitrans TaxID=35570 RepID=UPI0027E35045|nr:uncharacterized protein LOC131994814 [Stomoxys calcitrans]